MSEPPFDQSTTFARILRVARIIVFFALLATHSQHNSSSNAADRHNNKHNNTATHAAKQTAWTDRVLLYALSAFSSASALEREGGNETNTAEAADDALHREEAALLLLHSALSHAQSIAAHSLRSLTLLRLIMLCRLVFSSHTQQH